MPLKSYSDYLKEAEVAADAPPASQVGTQSPSMVRNTMMDVYGSAGKAGSKILFDAKRLLMKIMDKYPGDLRRLLRRMLSSGDFDDELAFKTDMQQLLEDLTTSKARGTARKAGKLLTPKAPKEPKNVVARPEADAPGGPLADSGMGS